MIKRNIESRKNVSCTKGTEKDVYSTYNGWWTVKKVGWVSFNFRYKYLMLHQKIGVNHNIYNDYFIAFHFSFCFNQIKLLFAILCLQKTRIYMYRYDVMDPKF